MTTMSFSKPSVHQEFDKNSGNICPPPIGPLPAPAKPKARKQSDKPSSAAKRPPQRGLGVAQLERLRLQEHMEKLLAGDDSTRQINSQQLLRQVQLIPRPPGMALYGNQLYARNLVYLDPSSNQQPEALLCLTDQNWYTSRCISPAILDAWGHTTAPSVDVTSILSDQYKMDLFGTTTGVESNDTMFLRSVGVHVLEPPSTQMTQCHYAKCDFCNWKKQLFGDGQMQNMRHAVAYFDVNAAATGTVHQEVLESYGLYEGKGKSIKEFEFFPASSHSTALAASEDVVGFSFTGSNSIVAASTSGDVLSTSNFFCSSISTATAAPKRLDLSLKL